MIFTGIVIFDIDGVVRDVSQSYRRAIAETVAHYTQGAYKPTMGEIDQLKAEGIWNNDWQASHELISRYDFVLGNEIDYDELVTFFQGLYRGQNWDGYITTEPILMPKEYLDSLTTEGFRWGFFSGATRGSAEYILKKKLGLENPVLVAMEDAPGKPDPTGLFQAIAQLEDPDDLTPVFYVGDTVGDMNTITEANKKQPERVWRSIGILPPHVQLEGDLQYEYAEKLQDAGAAIVLPQVTDLIPIIMQALMF